MTGSQRSTIVATVLGGVFAAIVGVVAVTVVAVFVCRRKKRKQVVLHHTAMSNPVYEGNEFQQTWHKFAQLSIIFFCCSIADGTFVAKEKDKVDSQLTWVPSEYEEPVFSAPQYEMV